jgi:hypothetical protein
VTVVRCPSCSNCERITPYRPVHVCRIFTTGVGNLNDWGHCCATMETLGSHCCATMGAEVSVLKHIVAQEREEVIIGTHS